MSALLTAIEKAGGQIALARRLGLRQGHIWQWLNKAGWPPLKYCPSIEAETGVRCELLRPDVTWNRDVRGVPVSYTVLLEGAPFAT